MREGYCARGRKTGEARVGGGQASKNALLVAEKRLYSALLLGGSYDQNSAFVVRSVCWTHWRRLCFCLRKQQQFAWQRRQWPRLDRG